MTARITFDPEYPLDRRASMLELLLDMRKHGFHDAKRGALHRTTRRDAHDHLSRNAELHRNEVSAAATLSSCAHAVSGGGTGQNVSPRISCGLEHANDLPSNLPTIE